MIKAKEMIPKSIIEVTTPFVILDGEPGAILTNNLKEINVDVGEKYEIIKCGKKNGALVLELKQTTEPYKQGKQWVVFCNNHFKIISKPELTNTNFKENEALLNSDEEFVIVNKAKPDLYLITVNYIFSKNGSRSEKADDIIEGDLVYTKKKSERKRLKNLQSLHGFLLNLTSFLNDFYFEEDKTVLYHLHSLFNTPEWTHNVSNKIDLEELKNLELRKYNTTTKSVYNQAVDFDIYQAVKNKVSKFNLTKKYGEAVSHVLSTLKDDNKVLDYPFLISIKYNQKFLEGIQYNYHNNCFKEKDTEFDLAIKSLKIKRSENNYYQNNSFACIAFKSESDAVCFKKFYNSVDRKVEILNTNDLLNDNEEIIIKRISKKYF